MRTKPKSVSSFQYLIIGGTTKAATTSLFSYLSEHPSICAASYKETRFFLSPDYPLPSKYRFSGDVEEYNLLFSECQDNLIRLESTPDYLYCSSALKSISEFLPNAKLVFSLRDPISRLISWYRFSIQIGRLPESLSIDEYVEELFEIGDGNKSDDDPERSDLISKENTSIEQFMQVLPQGCYASYLKHYFDCLGQDRIYTTFFEDLIRSPLSVMQHLCQFADLDSTFFQDYTFKVTNQTETMRNPDFHKKYRSFRFQVRRWTHDKPFIHKTLQAMRRGFEPIYLRLNTRTSEGVTLSDDTQRRLVDYYRNDVAELTELLEKEPPWEVYS